MKINSTPNYRGRKEQKHNDSLVLKESFEKKRFFRPIYRGTPLYIKNPVVFPTSVSPHHSPVSIHKTVLIETQKRRPVLKPIESFTPVEEDFTEIVTGRKPAKKNAQSVVLDEKRKEASSTKRERMNIYSSIVRDLTPGKAHVSISTD
jgi:hypothetical protein